MTSEDHAGLLRLRTIVRLRWIAVSGQAVTVAVVHFGFGFELPLAACAVIIMLSGLLNIFLRIRYSARLWLKSQYATAMLAYDVLQLTALLYLTGGLQNPFAFLIVAPVSVSASKQPVRHTLFLGLFAIICITALGLFHLPLPWRPGETLSLPPVYILGVWGALVSGVIFFALYSQRIAKEARQMSAALAATETVLLREQSMSALDRLAAAAAHELGTPLSTIAVVATELLRDLPADSPQRDDLTLLRSQAERCREILAKLTTGADEPDAIYSQMPISHLLEEAAEPYRVFDVEIEIEAGPATAVKFGTHGSREPVGSRNPGILYGLGNLIENAADFAQTHVGIAANWDRDTVEITISDDGPGIPPAILDRLGEPYVTTRAANEADAGSHEHGLGLGFFIAKTLLERSGARLEFANRQAPDHGAQVTIVWPRAAIEDEDNATAPALA